jgi:hypothetical protein
VTEVADRLGVSRQSVHNRIDRHDAGGLRSGRKSGYPVDPMYRPAAWLLLVGGVVVAIVAVTMLTLDDSPRERRMFSVRRGESETFQPGIVQPGDKLRCVGGLYDSSVRAMAPTERFDGWADTTGISYHWDPDGSLKLTCRSAALV